MVFCFKFILQTTSIAVIFVSEILLRSIYHLNISRLKILIIVFWQSHNLLCLKDVCWVCIWRWLFWLKIQTWSLEWRAMANSYAMQTIKPSTQERNMIGTARRLTWRAAKIEAG